MLQRGDYAREICYFVVVHASPFPLKPVCLFYVFFVLFCLELTLMCFFFCFSLVLFVCFYPVFAWLVRNPTKSSPA